MAHVSHRNLPTNLDDALRFLGGKTERKAGNNTLLRSYSDGVSVRYHGHSIVFFHLDGQLTISDGGWQTPTTKERLNIVLGENGHIRQKDFRWYFTHPDGTVEDWPGSMTIWVGNPPDPNRVDTLCICGATYGILDGGKGYGYSCGSPDGINNRPII